MWVQQWNFSFILCVTEFQLRPLSLVCIKWGVHVAKHPQWHGSCNPKGVNLFRNQLNLTQMSERKSNITQRKIKTSLIRPQIWGCLRPFFVPLWFKLWTGNCKNHRNEPLFQWHLICLARSSLQDARSSAITLLNQFPYTQGRNVLVWLI